MRVYVSRGPAMIRDEDGAFTGYVYLDLNTNDYGGFVDHANRLMHEGLSCRPDTRGAGQANTNSNCVRRNAFGSILPIVFFVIFLLLYLVFKSVAEAAVLIFPTALRLVGWPPAAMDPELNFSVAVWVGYIALFGIAVETGVVMVVYLDEALEIDSRRCPYDRSGSEAGRHRRRGSAPSAQADDGVGRILSLAPILWESVSART